MNALITGGGGDLAGVLKNALLDAGYDVNVPGRTELDATDSSSIATYFNEVSTLDLLINQAGVTHDGSVLKLSQTDWDHVIDVNLKGAFLCAQRALKLMLKARRGHIVNIGSFSALRPPAGQANYAAAKAGLIGLTQSLAAEVGKRNVRVNTVLPGFLETKMTAQLPPAVRDKARGDHVLGRFNTLEDASKFVVFLDQMEHVSGQLFQLDSRVSRW